MSYLNYLKKIEGTRIKFIENVSIIYTVAVLSSFGLLE